MDSCSAQVTIRKPDGTTVTGWKPVAEMSGPPLTDPADPAAFIVIPAAVGTTCAKVRGQNIHQGDLGQ